MNKRILVILAIILILLLSIVSIAFSKNSSKVTGNSSVSVARPIINIYANQIKGNMSNIEDEGIIEIYVKNYDENNNLSDVAQKFYIEIYSDTSSLDMSNFNIYAKVDNENINIANNKTEDITLGKSTKEDKKIEIRIKCKNNIENDITGEIKARIIVTQQEPSN